MEEEEHPHEMTDKELLTEFQKWIQEYKEWVNNKFDLDESWIEEAEYMSYARSWLHATIQELEKRRLAHDTIPVKKLDQEWQAWIVNNKAKDFVLEQPRNHIPKNTGGIGLISWRT